MIKQIVIVTISILILGLVAVPMIVSETELPPESDVLNVYVLAGQSNSAYYNEDVEVANEMPSIKDGFAFYYGTSSEPITCGTIANMQYDTTLDSYGIYSMTDSDGAFRIGNIESAFASVFVNETNQKCLIINTGIGGISINSYVPGQVGFTYATEIIEDAISKVDSSFDVELKGVMWVQGESDNALSVDTYLTQLEKVHDGFESLGFKKMFLSETRPINGGNSTFAQKIAPEFISGVYLACTESESFTIANGMIANDNLHYTQKADNIIGSQFANYIIVNQHYPVKMAESYSSLILIIPMILVLGVVVSAFYVLRMRD